MKLNSQQLNQLISKSVSDSVDRIDVNGEIQTVQDYFKKSRSLNLTWEKDYIRKTLNKIHRDSVNASLSATVSLLKELGLIDIKD